MEKQAFQLLLNKLEGIDKRLESGDATFKEVYKKLEELNSNLEVNNIELAKHVMSSVATNKRLSIVEEIVFKYKKNLQYIELFFCILSPTKKKIAWTISLISLFFAIIKLIHYLKANQII